MIQFETSADKKAVAIKSYSRRRVFAVAKLLLNPH